MMKFLFKNRDRRVSVFTFLFSIYWLFEAHNIKAIAQFFDGSDPGPRLFPYIVGVIMLVCSIGKFVTCNQEEPESFFGKEGWTRLFAVVALLSVYVFAMKYVGYIISTLIASAALLLIMKEDRKMKRFSPIIFAVCFTVISYLLFDVALGNTLPVGSLIKPILRALK